MPRTPILILCSMTPRRMRPKAPHCNWGADAPRGGKAVMNRILKDKAPSPPLSSRRRLIALACATWATIHHLGTLRARRQRHSGGAPREVRVFFRQTGKKATTGSTPPCTTTGSGMPPPVLKVAHLFRRLLNSITARESAVSAWG